MAEAELNELSLQVFRTFARCEYALKAAGFHNGEGKAEANWRGFALSIEDLFVEPLTPALKAAVDYILAHPPKKQIIKNDLLEWEAAPPETDSRADLVLLYVRRVRNNLFHGGKFNGHWFDPERSEVLLRHSLQILTSSIQHSDRVRQAYG